MEKYQSPPFVIIAWEAKSIWVLSVKFSCLEKLFCNFISTEFNLL